VATESHLQHKHFANIRGSTLSQYQCVIIPYSTSHPLPVCCGHSTYLGGCYTVAFSPLATPAADDCLTFRTLIEETYQSGKISYDSPYDWLEYIGSGVYIPQCLEDGSYATVQCSNTSLPVEASYSSYRARYCWCVDPATGIPTSNDYGANVEPSPDECPYYDTAALCQVRGEGLCRTGLLNHSWHFACTVQGERLKCAVFQVYVPLLP